MPTKTTGHCGSVSMRLIPAPRGAGIVAARTPKKAWRQQLLVGRLPDAPPLLPAASCQLPTATTACISHSAYLLLQARLPPFTRPPAAPGPCRLQVLQMAGIEDCYTASAGNTKTLGNTVRATFYALAVSLLIDCQKWCCAPAAEQSRAGCRGSAWRCLTAVRAANRLTPRLPSHACTLPTHLRHISCGSAPMASLAPSCGSTRLSASLRCR